MGLNLELSTNRLSIDMPSHACDISPSYLRLALWPSSCLHVRLPPTLYVYSHPSDIEFSTDISPMPSIYQT